MRSYAALLALVLTALVGGPAAAVTAPVAAKASPDLVARGGSAAYANGQLTVKLKFRNKGAANAAKSTGAFAVSKDKLVSDDDRGISTMKVPALTKGKGTTVKATVAVPGTVPAGTYYVVYCADYKTKVAESDEGNNCGSTKKPVKIAPGTTTTPPPPTSAVTISAVAGTGGSVTAATSGGSCAALSCTVPAGAGTVTFTPTAATGYTFSSWSGCSGYTGTSAITFTNPTANATCTAVFTATTTPPPTPVTVTVSYKAAGLATVTATATSGTCSGTGSATVTGTCTVPSGASTVTLTASGTLLGVNWSGCTGTVSGNTIKLVNPTAATTCTATPKLV